MCLYVNVDNLEYGSFTLLLVLNNSWLNSWLSW